MSCKKGSPKSEGSGRPPVPRNIPLDLTVDLDLSAVQPRKFTHKEWSELPHEEVSKHVQAVYMRYALGKETMEQILESYGFNHWRWYTFMSANPHLYLLRNIALEIKVEQLANETKDIADDGSNDWMEDRYGNKMVNKEAVCRSQLRMNQRLRMINILLSQRKFIFNSDAELKDRLNALMKKFAAGEIDNTQTMAFLKAFETEASISEKYDWLKRLEALEKKAK